jgi:hypothetical protein
MSAPARRSNLAGSAAVAGAANEAIAASAHANAAARRSIIAAHGPVARAAGPDVVEADTMVMALPFVMALVAALFAYAGLRKPALALAALTVVVQVWWLLYHATSDLSIVL